MTRRQGQRIRQPHHTDPHYITTAQLIRDLANNDPHTICARNPHGQPCGLTLQQHPPGATWTAGHTIDGSTTWQPWTNTRTTPPPGDWLAPQASTCNYAAAAHRTNRGRGRTHSRDW